MVQYDGRFFPETLKAVLADNHVGLDKVVHPGCQVTAQYPLAFVFPLLKPTAPNLKPTARGQIGKQ